LNVRPRCSAPVAGTGTAHLWTDEPPSEQPTQNVPEYWDIYNTTADTHPIHLHEVLFQVVSRQKFKWTALDDVLIHEHHISPGGPHTSTSPRRERPRCRLIGKQAARTRYSVPQAR